MGLTQVDGASWTSEFEAHSLIWKLAPKQHVQSLREICVDKIECKGSRMSVSPRF